MVILKTKNKTKTDKNSSPRVARAAMSRKGVRLTVRAALEKKILPSSAITPPSSPWVENWRWFWRFGLVWPTQRCKCQKVGQFSNSDFIYKNLIIAIPTSAATFKGFSNVLVGRKSSHSSFSRMLPAASIFPLPEKQLGSAGWLLETMIHSQRT